MTPTDHTLEDFAGLLTEQRNSRSQYIDLLSTDSILRLINSEDKLVALAVEKEIPYITRAVEIVVESFRNDGRLLYFGAGTSGRLGVIDASECPPTFGTPPGMVSGHIAGGNPAMIRSQEGAEDNKERGIRDIDTANVTPHDVVCGIAASRRTPYVVAAVGRARELGAKTIYITTNPRASFDLDVDIAICPEVGPEVLMGSTRMKSGTAQKLVLNMLTTASMIKLGKVYENMMVDLQLTNNKLVERAKRIIMMITEVDYEVASSYLEKAGGQVKTAVVMIANKMTRSEAQACLQQANGFVRVAIGRE
ncbi:MAG: N-acetylmuramic acid 6-phosphate etherase [Bacteroidetes bacterium]|nr:N-acetylmuramic acid 6-phosphate etherase [Bacteroidota bacterium]MCW5894604.1 N-acetylmuramic acid 6-phosphate etherase [Bacteroidota bacterium]